MGLSWGCGGIEEGSAKKACLGLEELLHHTGEGQGQADENEEEERCDHGKSQPMPKPDALFRPPVHGLPFRQVMPNASIMRAWG